MGGLFSGPSMPPMPAPAPAPSTADDAEAKAASERERKRQLLAASGANNIKNGPGGLTEVAPTQKKVLLGG